jgi:hypothetical protein
MKSAIRLDESTRLCFFFVAVMGATTVVVVGTSSNTNGPTEEEEEGHDNDRVCDCEECDDDEEHGTSFCRLLCRSDTVDSDSVVLMTTRPIDLFSSSLSFSSSCCCTTIIVCSVMVIGVVVWWYTVSSFLGAVVRVPACVVVRADTRRAYYWLVWP